MASRVLLPYSSRSRWAAAADVVQPPGAVYRRDPILWATERANLELWSKQRQILESVRDNPQTAVHSCHEIGKSFIASAAVAWWIDSHPAGEAFAVTTAPTDKQVRAVLWREINRLHKRCSLGGRTNLTEWYLGQEMVAFGRKPADHDPAAFQGMHARYMLVVLDEACGIPKNLWDAASTLGANEFARVLAIGNPDDTTGEFYANCKPDSGWNVIGIGYEDTPNFTGEKISTDLRQLLISPQWVAGREKKWGRESALFTSKCRGQFPVGASLWTVVPIAWAEICRNLELPPSGESEAGIDVGAGSDRTVLSHRRGGKLLDVITFVDPDPMRSVGRLVQKINELGIKKIKIDPIGVGWALAGRLQELSRFHNPYSPEATHDAEVIGVNFAELPDPGKEHLYLNKRAQVWWEVGRENCRLQRWDISVLDDDALQELTTPTYEIMDSRGKIKIQPKKDVVKEIGRSPDVADSVLLAFFDATSVATISQQDTSAYDLLQGVVPGQM